MIGPGPTTLAFDPECPALDLADVRDLVRSGAARGVGRFAAATGTGPNHVDFGVDAAEVLAAVEEEPYWVVVADIEAAPEMRACRDRVLEAIRRDIERHDGPVERIGIAVLVSGPDAAVPVHVNDYHDVTVQTAGTRIFRIGAYPDPATANEVVEAMYVGADLSTAPVPDDPVAHDLGPGDGLYVPSETPHWLDGGSGVAVQVTVTAWTTTGRRRADVHRLNRRIRAAGLRPRPVGASPRIDVAKAGVWALARRIRRR